MIGDPMIVEKLVLPTRRCGSINALAAKRVRRLMIPFTIRKVARRGAAGGIQAIAAQRQSTGMAGADGGNRTHASSLETVARPSSCIRATKSNTAAHAGGQVVPIGVNFS
jgi:hypothetical protein